MIILILSLNNYLTLRFFLKGKRRRDLPYWIILKTIMLRLKKSRIITKHKTISFMF